MSSNGCRDVVVIGGSAGSVEALITIASSLPGDLPAAVFVAVHMPVDHRSILPELLARRTSLAVAHAIDGETIEHGRVYVAPPDNHLQLRQARVGVARGPKENGNRPSVDVMFRSASQAYGARVIGVVLSGHSDCGTQGLMSIKARGGLAIVQDPEDAQTPSMPESAIRNTAVDHVVPLQALGALLDRLVREVVALPAVEAPHVVLEIEGVAKARRGAELVCPVCHGRLTESDVGRYPVFRCHTGHSFSLDALMAEQAEELERTLWAAVRSLQESAALSGRLARSTTGAMSSRFAEKERTQHEHAERLRDVLLGRTTLTAPGSDEP